MMTSPNVPVQTGRDIDLDLRTMARRGVIPMPFMLRLTDPKTRVVMPAVLQGPVGWKLVRALCPGDPVSLTAAMSEKFFESSDGKIMNG